jgi:CPA1 family monovalent cation:H+ antiporter
MEAQIDLRITLVLLAGLLILVSLLQPLATRLRLPASVLLAAVGISIGAVSTFLARAETGGTLGAVAHIFVDLPVDSNTFLYVFLPALLFQSALSIEVQRIIEDAGPVLLLAVVAVLVATFVIGFALAPFAEVSLVACLMLGAMVATTDPVAVIGIFADVGAPSRLTRLVAGEALLNDAAAIALFSLLLTMQLGGQAGGVGAAALVFIRQFAGGLIFGYVCARIVASWFSWLQDLRLAQVSLTVALPYLAFIIGERALGVSGVVSAVSAGLVLNAIGQPRITPGDWLFLHDVWEQIAFWASSLIFVLASLLVPRLVTSVGWHDVLMLTVLVLAALVARALVLYVLIPVLTALRLSQQIDNKFKAVILWGGLRGAVTLALALAVTENDAIDPAVQRFIAVLATGFVLFTLLISGTTLRMLIGLLGLDRLSPFDQALRMQVLSLSRDRVAGVIRRVGRQFKFPDDLVRGLLAEYRDGSPARVAPASNRTATKSASIEDESDRLRLGLIAMGTLERELILDHFSSRTVSGRIVEELLENAGRLIDRTRAKGLPEYLQTAHEIVGFSSRFRLAHFLHRRFGIEYALEDVLADRFERLLVSRIVLEELSESIVDKLGAIVGDRLTPRLVDLLNERRAMTASALEAMGAQYPEYAAILEKRFLKRVALRHQAREQKTLFEHQVIGPELFSVLTRELQAVRSGVDARPRLDLGLETRALIAQVPMFAELDRKQLEAVANLLKPRFVVPGEMLIHKGDRGDSMYFICSGEVEVHAAGKSIKLARGDFFGEMALLLAQPRQADVTALSYCLLLTLEDEDFQALLKGSKDIRTRIDAAASARQKMNEAVQQL